MNEQDGINALLDAMSLNDVNKAREILNQGISPDSCLVDSGHSILQTAVYFGNAKITLELLKKSQEYYNVMDSENRTLLHLACMSDSIETVDVVLRQGEYKGGFDLNAQDKDGNTPLHHARYVKNNNIAIKLITFGADPFLTNKKGKTHKDIAQELRDSKTTCTLSGPST